ncbi:MAG: metallophosphoesterase [Opitutales bacterium]
MIELPRLGMTDVKRGSRIPCHYWLSIGLPVLLLGYILLRNVFYFKAGLLDPNFGIIHAAFDFNLWELPWTLLALALVLAFLAAVLSVCRKALICWCIVYVFVAGDLFLLRYYVTSVEPERMVVRRVAFKTPKLGRPVRLLHISDIQAGSIGDYEHRLFKRIELLEPDLIVYTGDFLQVVPPATFEEEWPKLRALFEEVDPPLGVFAVFGDVEREFYRLSQEELGPVRMLSSASERIEVGGGAFSLHGLSLFESRDPDWAQRSLQPWLEASEEASFKILFGHSPDFALGVGEEPIDLCLAGHTHGGQVRLPGYGPLVIDSEIPREWARGFRSIGAPFLNVSAGAGSNRFEGLPPIRFNCPTEMTLIELAPQS